MNLANDSIAEAANAIRSGNFTQNTLDVLRKIVIQNNAKRLVEELIPSERANCETEEDAISQAMFLLESLGNTAPPIACVLMAYLWPIAGYFCMHDVCDRIDLWVWHCNEPELADQLRLIASSEKDPSIQRHYEQWVESKSKFDTLPAR